MLRCAARRGTLLAYQGAAELKADLGLTSGKAHAVWKSVQALRAADAHAAAVATGQTGGTVMPFYKKLLVYIVLLAIAAIGCVVSLRSHPKPWATDMAEQFWWLVVPITVDIICYGILHQWLSKFLAVDLFEELSGDMSIKEGLQSSYTNSAIISAFMASIGFSSLLSSTPNNAIPLGEGVMVSDVASQCVTTARPHLCCEQRTEQRLHAAPAAPAYV